MSSFSHLTVLLEETVALVRAEVGRVIVDGTLGGGGHSEALLAQGATVYGIDRDPRARAAATERLAKFGDRFHAIDGTFAEMASLVPGPVDGIVLDLGVSSPQLDEAARGFSFMHDGPLDMRMGADGVTAAELIATTDEGDLADLIFEYGEERLSRPIARALKADLPQTTFAAVESIKRAVPKKAWPKETHVATRTFQALRIAVNAELEQLDRALEAIPSMLKPGGVAAIITFHSLEDRAVKQSFRKLCGADDEPDMRVRELKALAGGSAPVAAFRSLTKKPITAGEAELSNNPRARSAKLRAVEKVS